MLRELLIKNLILIEESSLFFEKGFTVISGETGAGKTALVTALHFILGERVDPSKVRNPQERALVQAAFELKEDSPLLDLLEGWGMKRESSLLIQREILPNGRSRALVCGELVSLAQLQTLAPHLILLSGQSAQEKLRSEGAHLELLDQFAETQPLQKQFGLSFTEQKGLEEKLKTLEEQVEPAKITLQKLQSELEELGSANLTEGEEGGLFAEYEQLLKTEEFLQKSEELLQLFEAESGILSQLKMAGKIVQGLSLDPACVAQMQSLSAELLGQISRFQTRLESSPERLVEIDERLKLIDRLKKRYGNPFVYGQSIKAKVSELESLEDQILEIKELVERVEAKTSLLRKELSLKRKEAATRLGPALAAQLQALNMQGAEVEMRLTETICTSMGAEKAALYLKANRGEKAIAVSESSSGGELARLFLSLTFLLAEKNGPVTLIFDEIDANVGGKTATVVGEELKKLGHSVQVISITHFPQLAQLADQHIRILKIEEAGRTTTRAELLGEEERAFELARMRG